MFQCHIHCQDQHQKPLEEVHVVLVAPNGTYISAHSDSHGVAQLNLPDQQIGTLLLAHKSCSGQIVKEFQPDKQTTLALYHHSQSHHGSTIFEMSTGEVSTLKGRLNPILDTSGRTYIYGDNVSFNNESIQPAEFKVSVPFIAEDALRNRFNLEIKFILGRTSLIDYQKI